MEVTLLDALLLLWAVIASTRWADYRRETNTLKGMLVAFVENDALRDRLVASYKRDFNR